MARKRFDPAWTAPISKDERVTQQQNRLDRDGNWLLMRLAAEFPEEHFTRDDVMDAFSDLTADPDSEKYGRNVNVAAGLNNLIERDYISEESGELFVTDSGRLKAEALEDEEDPLDILPEDDFD